LKNEEGLDENNQLGQERTHQEGGAKKNHKNRVFNRGKTRNIEEGILPT